MSGKADKKQSALEKFLSGEALVLPEDDSIIERKRREKEKPKRKWYSIQRRYSEIKKEPPSTFVLPTIETNDHIRNIFASSISSSFSRAAAQPFDRLKALMQLDHGSNVLFQSMYRAAHLLYVEKGIMEFYKGHTVAQTVSLFQSIALFYSYEMLMHLFLLSPIAESTELCTFLCGFVSGAITVITTHPLEEVKLRQLARRKVEQRFAALSAARQMLTKPGLRHLYFNFVPSVLHVSSLYGCKFMFYNMCCDQMLVDTTDDAMNRVDLDGWQLITAGAISGVVSNFLTHPLDLVKKRLGMSGLQRQHYHFDGTCRKLLQCFSMVMQRQGLLGFYKGLMPNMLRSMVFSSVQFSVFDKVRQWADSAL